MFTILALVLYVAVLCIAQFEIGGVAGKVLDMAAEAFKIVIPLFLAISVMAFISSRLEGFGFILFCDENVKATMQTAANMHSVRTAIAGFILYGVAIVASIVAAFFSLRKKAK